MPRHFITLLDFTKEEILDLLLTAKQLKLAWDNEAMLPKLKNKRFALIWDTEGFRNRVAFELGITVMGGTYVQIPGQLDQRESIEDVSLYLSDWFDAIIARTRSHDHMLRLTKQNIIPVINARTNYNHPCEILGDLQYILTKHDRLDGLKVAFIGETTNLCISWFEAAARLPIKVVQVCPNEYMISKQSFSQLSKNAIGDLSTSNDLELSIKNVDVLYTDCWPSHNNDNSGHIRDLFIPYQITADRIKKLCPNVIFLPCPPVTRGEEVSIDAMEIYGRYVYEAKENLLHAQNALLITLLKK